MKKKLKNVLAVVLVPVVFVLICNLANAEIPDWVGRSDAPTPKWANYIGAVDGIAYVVSVSHWAPQKGETVTFQDGETAIVEGGWRPRRKERGHKWGADVWIGWLDHLPSTIPAEVWWEDPEIPDGSTI